MKLPTRDVLLMLPLLPRAWLALRRARARLASSLQSGLQLQATAPRLHALHVGRSARVIFALGRRMRGCACLVQAIALADVLRASGRDARVVIGAGREWGVFHAHAWVELEGAVLDPQPSDAAALKRLQSFG